MRDVAELAGVSVGTVSNVLNRPDVVAPGTRARVQAAIAELGFVRSENARLLRVGRSRVLALLALDLANPFYVEVLRGAQCAARDAGLGVVVVDSAGSAIAEAGQLALLAQQRVRGVMVTPADGSGGTLAEFGRSRIPFVLVDREVPGCEAACRVLVDDVAGGEMAVAHLVAAGHRRIGFVAGPLGVAGFRHRLAGARRGAAGGGSGGEGVEGIGGASAVDAEAPVELVVIEEPRGDIAAGRDAAARVLGMSAAQRPTALFCANDLIALGVLQALFAAGVTVPGEMAIVGYGDLESAAGAAVPLTSIRQPAARLGRAAAELLIEESGPLAAQHAHREVVFQPELVARASSLPVRVAVVDRLAVPQRAAPRKNSEG
jgi:LacI family transcriptional regulator